MLGPLATRGLRRHGLLYPANAHMVVPMAEQAVGGHLLTGVGGDDVFGNWPWHDLASVLPVARVPAPGICVACSTPLPRSRFAPRYGVAASRWGFRGSAPQSAKT